jgi:DNA-binding transcriptional LysR family regulator
MIVSLTKLQQLVTIARCESLTRAADALGISQPALSRTVAFIEDVYGVKIFDRTPQGVVSTAAGAALIAEAERVVRDADTFDHNARLIGGGKLGQLSFAMSPLVAEVLMGKAGIALLAAGKRISFRAQTRRADYVIKALLEDDLELGLVGMASFEVPDEIAVRPVGKMRTAVIARAGHPLAGKASVSVAEARQFPVASPMDMNQLRPFHPVAHNISCDDYGAMAEMVVASDTICVCSAIFAQKATGGGEIVTLAIDMPADQRESEVVALTLKGRTVSPAVELVIDRCRELLENATRGQYGP